MATPVEPGGAVGKMLNGAVVAQPAVAEPAEVVKPAAAPLGHEELSSVGEVMVHHLLPLGEPSQIEIYF